MDHESDQSIKRDPIKELQEEAICWAPLRSAGKLEVLNDAIAQSACEALVELSDGGREDNSQV